MANGRTFNAQLGKWAQQFPQKMDGLARQTSQQISENVVRDTPVDTGFLRSSWQPSIGSPQSGKGSEFGSAGSGGAAAGAKVATEIGLKIADMKAGDLYYMTNNAKYAPYLEFGTSKIAPRYFVTDNVKRWRAVVSRMVKELGLS